jgi:transposase-like protein
MSKAIARVFSREFKLEVVRRMEAGTNISALARELGIRRKLLNQWRDAFRRGGPAALRGVGRPRKASLASDPPPTEAAATDPLGSARERIAALERKVGQQQLELDFFKRALRQVEASRRPSDGPGATASTPSSRR